MIRRPLDMATLRVLGVGLKDGRIAIAPSTVKGWPR